MTQLVDTARDLDERTARDIIDTVACARTGCPNPARWVTLHSCGTARFVCHQHRQKIDAEAVRERLRPGSTELPVCANCGQPWPIPWTWDRI